MSSPDYKNLFSGLLGFVVVVMLNMDSAANLTRNGVFVPLFVLVLVTQILLEILSKYQGKVCETIEGLFTALIAVIGYGLYTVLASKGLTGGAQAVYGQQMVSTNKLDMGQALVAGGIVAILLFLWKKWLKPMINIQAAFPKWCPAPPAVPMMVPLEPSGPPDAGTDAGANTPSA